MACHGECVRLYKATRKKGDSLYLNNKFCGHCARFINLDGVYLDKTLRCKCCRYKIRSTPYTGRKSIPDKKINLFNFSKHLNKVSISSYDYEEERETNDKSREEFENTFNSRREKSIKKTESI